MVDAGRAERPNGTAYVGGKDTTTYDPLFEAACKVKPPRLVSREAEVGARTAVTIPGELHLPATAEHAGLQVGDTWVITAAHDLSLAEVGERYRITSEADGTLVTACRYSVERVVT